MTVAFFKLLALYLSTVLGRAAQEYTGIEYFQILYMETSSDT